MSRLRVLHVIGALNYGGIERWLLRVLGQLDRARFQCDIMTLSAAPGPLDGEARALGVRLLPCPGYRQPWRFAPRFLQIVREHGPYDLIHTHLKEYSGLVLALARWAGIPVRIAHSHNDLGARQAAASPPVRLYRQGLKALVARHATVRLGVSPEAGASLFGAHGPPWRYLPCGIELAPFCSPPPRQVARARLGLPPDALVVGHVGRMVAQKNHQLLLASFAALSARRPDSRLLLVGNGPLRPALEAQIAALGLDGRVVMAGERADVPALLAAMDVFALPSLYEGLPVAAVEAQASGLPCVLAPTITAAAAVVPALVHVVAPAAPAEAWAEALLAAATTRERPTPAEALELIRRSPLNLERGIAELVAIYTEEAARARRA